MQFREGIKTGILRPGRLQGLTMTTTQVTGRPPLLKVFKKFIQIWEPRRPQFKIIY